MKLCSRCGIWLPLESFTVNTARKDGLQNNCRECQRAYLRQHYARNTSYYLAKAKRSNDARYARLRGHLIDLKSVPCADCGRRYPPWVMDFDHVRGDKLFDVGSGLRGNTTALLAEAAKCEVVCSNCHRDRTHRRRVVRP